MKTDIAVLGAGIIGICTALSLQKRGQQVTLIDSKPPASETSYGNAGIVALNALVPLNNPGLFSELPGLLTNRHPALRYSPAYAVKNAIPLSRFLWQAQHKLAMPRMLPMHQLLQYSSPLHQQYLTAAGQQQRLRNTGWLKLYRNKKQRDGADYERARMDQHGVRYELLDTRELKELEPNLKPVFSDGMLINDISSVDNPAAVAHTYAEQFVALGGTIKQYEITTAQQDSDKHWQLQTTEGDPIQCQQLVVALGPWSKDFLERLALKLPMFNERGGHRHFEVVTDKSISRPVYDASGGYVITPMEMGLRLTCGVELNALDAYYGPEQLNQAEQTARSGFHIGEKHPTPDWMGSRPTLPDSLPAIGACKYPGLWLNTGHQHIGFSTAPGSGELLADMMIGKEAMINMKHFAPARFGV